MTPPSSAFATIFSPPSAPPSATPNTASAGSSPRRSRRRKRDSAPGSILRRPKRADTWAWWPKASNPTSRSSPKVSSRSPSASAPRCARESKSSTADSCVSRPGSSLLDHLVRAPEKGLRNREAEGLGGLEVDHQLELGRLLNGKIGGLRSSQDLVHVGGRAAGHVGQAGPVGHETASVHVLPLCIDGRQPVPLRQARDLASVHEPYRIRRQN